MKRNEIHEIIDDARKHLEGGRTFRRDLGDGGVISLRGKIPFLAVYRRPERPDIGTERFATVSDCHLILPNNFKEKYLTELLHLIAGVICRPGEPLLITEIWADDTAPIGHEALARNVANIYTHKNAVLDSTVNTLKRTLGRSLARKMNSKIGIVHTFRIAPDGARPLLRKKDRQAINAQLVGIGVRPVYRNATGTALDEQLLHSIRRNVGRALYEAFCRFAYTLNRGNAHVYFEVGQRAFGARILEIDCEFARISRSYDFLLSVTPVNVNEAWRGFMGSRFEKAPEFRYRPIVRDLDILKRRLYDIRIERLGDPMISRLFAEKRRQMDRRITMLSERGTRSFFHASCAMFGEVERGLVQVARKIVARYPTDRAEKSNGDQLDAEAIARAAQAEIERYRGIDPSFSAAVTISSDVYSGMLAGGSTLRIGKGVKIAKTRLQALLNHEVATHLLTYHNARLQPLRIFSLGLPGYEELQEGLAVLAEWLSGTMNANRLRQLAGRVLAVASMEGGADFIRTYRMLTEDCGFTAYRAYIIAMRVYRSGGFTKDAVYLKGFLNLINYLRSGGELEVLYAGKVAFGDIPLMSRLIANDAIHPPALLPLFLKADVAGKRIATIRRLGPDAIFDF